ncbi:hypothetical protein BOVMAS27_04600 [Streptococcus uberis]
MNNLKHKIIYSTVIKKILFIFFGIFYDKQYLKGYFFDEKRLGWYWAWRGLKGRLFGDNRSIPWPIHPNSIVSNANNIKFDVDDLNIFQVPGCYWQNHAAKTVIGKGSYVAPNVGIITTNHDVYNISAHSNGKDIILGKECWIGMNAVILPGVVLGDHTVVAAGSVVTKSFQNGYCVIGGVPATKIKDLSEERFSE